MRKITFNEIKAEQLRDAAKARFKCWWKFPNTNQKYEMFTNLTGKSANSETDIRSRLVLGEEVSSLELIQFFIKERDLSEGNYLIIYDFC